MNKKQKNRKLVSQNKRNRMINRRYTSTIKSLFKLFKMKVKKYFELDSNSLENITVEAQESIGKLVSPLNSILDKATKKKNYSQKLCFKKKIYYF
jgi:ribosomal protein S20